MDLLKSSWSHRTFVSALFSLSFYRFSIYGQFFLVEAFLFIFFLHSFFNLSHTRRNTSVVISNFDSNKFQSRIVKFLLLLSLISIVSGFVRASTFTDQIKGFALMIFTLTNFLGLIHLTKLRTDLLFSAFLGFALSGIFGFIFQPSAYARTEIWKFGLSYSLTYLLILFLMAKSRLKLRRYQFILISYGFLAIAMGTRSLGLCVITTGGLILYASRSRKGNREEKKNSKRFRVLWFVGLILLLLFTTSSVYGFAAKAGYLGDKSRSEYLIQSSGDFGPIVGGRVEPVIALIAVIQSPIFGYGYGADSGHQIYERANEFFLNHGYRVNLSDIQRKNEGSIPQHSYLLNFWISYGVLGLFFWIFVLRTLFRVLISEFYTGSPIFPLLSFVTVLTCWNMFFSPYGAGVRIEFALILALALAVIATQKNERVG